MHSKALNIPALIFYGLLCGALVVVLIVSFQHFNSFYSPQIIVRPKYKQTSAQEKAVENLKPQRVAFSYVSPSAKEVQVVGDFNAWGAYPLTLNKSDNDIEIFTLNLALPKGKYKFRFLVDGQVAIDESSAKIKSGNEIFNILEVK
ncbi:MAG: glycogen-binding domain-containing protein [Elusimicrobiaceae bacterium]|nr:glycogen-binding domain-containing protein [Elusimicrobiaceae bacterium]